MRNFFKLSIISTVLSCVLWIAAAAGVMVAIREHATASVPHPVAANTAAAESFIVNTMQHCKDTGSRKPCYQQAAKDFLNRYPLIAVLDVFQKHEKEPAFFDNCHQTSHYLGQEEYKRLGSVKLALAEANETCLGGTYHGALEGYFMQKHLVYGDEAANAAIAHEVATICGKAEDYAIPQKFYSCNHGLGHALMFATDNDLVEALGLCDNTATTNEQELCYSGAFMENYSDAHSDIHPSKYYKDNDPLYPCPILEHRYQNICYTYGVLTLYQANIPKAIELCSTIPADLRPACFRTFGRDRTMLSADPRNLIEQCQQVKNSEYQKECIKGSAYNLVVRFGIESQLAAHYCSIAPSAAQPDCYSQIIEAAKYQGSSFIQKQNFCNLILDRRQRDACIQKLAGKP